MIVLYEWEIGLEGPNPDDSKLPKETILGEWQRYQAWHWQLRSSVAGVGEFSMRCPVGRTTNENVVSKPLQNPPPENTAGNIQL